MMGTLAGKSLKLQEPESTLLEMKPHHIHVRENLTFPEQVFY